MASADDNSLPEALYSADAVQAIDRYVIDQQGVPGFELMQSAARAAFRRLVRQWPEASTVLVLCGAGNNGGDGYLVAANARRHGMEAACISVAPVEKLQGDARRAWQKARADDVTVKALDSLSPDSLAARMAQADVVVDAMLGTGVAGAPREPFAEVIRACNRSGRPVFAIDLPSGLNATTGAAAGEVIRADCTITFIALKAGLFTGRGPDCVGHLAFDDLNTADRVPDSGQQPVASRVDWRQMARQIPPRSRSAHKGAFGHAVVIAGNRGYGGAGLLAAEAAARSGAGLVTLATHPDHVSAALARCPSLMVRGVSHGNELDELLDKASSVVCGPGLGQDAWARQMLRKVLDTDVDCVLDADALNLLAALGINPGARFALTPHPGEAARLLGSNVAELEKDRLSAAGQLSGRTGSLVLLKGAGSVVSDGRDRWVVSGSNPGMATGGMGDVLSGIIGGLAGQVDGLLTAVLAGAALHLAAADYASRSKGYMGLLPMDVIEALPAVLARQEALVCQP
ncbi:MAG: NAD(P)H-hydrate dehydratase [Pseudomonadota bacterium]|nr:NAD(P)H-hydrate dehydratase [Pseudomonadota bacterium]